MHSITISDITQRLNTLPEDKLVVVYDFISYLASQVKSPRKKSRVKSPKSILISMEEYERLKRISEQKAAFYDLAIHLGSDVEKQGLTEDEFLADIKQTKREVFEKQYGRTN